MLIKVLIQAKILARKELIKTKKKLQLPIITTKS